MIINLKQSEIELALRAYVVSQGISLHGKDLSISFTAGRRESGISAEISIDDVEIPGYTDSVAVVEAAPIAAPVVTLVQPVAVEAPEVVAEVAAPAVAEAVEPVAEVKPTVSLFG